MKKVVIAAALALGIAAPAFAADMPMKAAPPMAPPLPIFSWTGFYIGGNIGGAWSNDRWNDTLFVTNFNNGNNGVFIGGILVPLAAAFDMRVRANRLSLFLPSAALMPTAIGVFVFKFLDLAQQKGFVHPWLQRPSETIELYLYIFILAYLVVFARRIREIEAEIK